LAAFGCDAFHRDGNQVIGIHAARIAGVDSVRFDG
jgi:hypothetical protein